MSNEQWVGLTATTPFNEASGQRRRRILAQAPGLIIEEIWYQGASPAGAEDHAGGHPHPHPHVSTTSPDSGHAHDLVSGHYILSGRFTGTVGDQEVLLGPGDCFVAPPGVAHHLECLVTGSTLLIRTGEPAQH